VATTQRLKKNSARMMSVTRDCIMLKDCG
jgi:hypothetical protein